MKEKDRWCHEECWKMAHQFEIYIQWNGKCIKEACNDEKCPYEHISYMEKPVNGT